MDNIIKELTFWVDTDETQNAQIHSRAQQIIELCDALADNLLLKHCSVSVGIVNDIRLCADWIRLLETADDASAKIKRDYLNQLKLLAEEEEQ